MCKANLCMEQVGLNHMSLIIIMIQYSCIIKFSAFLLMVPCLFRVAASYDGMFYSAGGTWNKVADWTTCCYNASTYN